MSNVQSGHRWLPPPSDLPLRPPASRAVQCMWSPLRARDLDAGAQLCAMRHLHSTGRWVGRGRGLRGRGAP
eukprot:911051-Alexandrium_andersonii.AAC.1